MTAASPAAIGPASRAATGTGAITCRWLSAVADSGPMAVGVRARWVLDPTDDLACVRALTAAHDLESGRIVCHTNPGASWPVLVRDLLTALGKDRDALARDHRVEDGPMLLAVWLRAEAVRDIVVLRAHTLAPAVRAAVVELGAVTGTTVWLVWHRSEPPPLVAGSPLVGWTHAAALLRGPRSRSVLANRAIAEAYGRTRDRARLDARAWATRSAPVAPRFVQPGAPLSVVLQRLTIDASSHAELLVRLHATQSGFRDQGLALALPAIADENRLAALGPRFDADTLRRLRRIACPTTAGALLLALATDVDSQQLASTSAFWTCATGRHIRFLAGTYRIPPHARPLLRAAVLAAVQPNILLADRHRRLFLARRMANLVQRAADRVGVPAPPAARPSSPWDRAQLYAPAFTTTASVTPAS